MFSMWNIKTTHQINLAIPLAFTAFTFVCFAYGKAFLSLFGTKNITTNSFNLQFLVGFFLFNTFLFITSLLSPFGVVLNSVILSLIALGLTLHGTTIKTVDSKANADIASFLCILICAIAATLWCTDSQSPYITNDHLVTFKTWQDTFFHVTEISNFARSTGINSIQDIRMAGAPAPVYHFASYLTAAAISEITNTPTIIVYFSFLLPFGIFLSGLAAFSLIETFLGKWPALVATIAVLLFPDAYHQGFSNRYLSYNFLAQVNYGLLYGIASISISWIFIIQGVQNRSLTNILVGYAFLAICLFYKAHIFVANSYLALIYPWIFWYKFKKSHKLLLIGALTLIFVSVIYISQKSDRIPTMRLDFSGLGTYISILISNYDAGHIKTLLTEYLFGQKMPRYIQGLFALSTILISSIGLWTFLFLIALKNSWKKFPLYIYFFPVLIILNYLLMASGLALDARGIGTPDELVNRPMVWAYFTVVTWSMGVIYYQWVGNSFPVRIHQRAIFFIFLCLGLLSVSQTSKDLQTFPARPGYFSYAEFNSVPTCLIKSAEFIRDNSQPRDIYQDSENDRRYIVSAITERQIYAGESLFGKPSTSLRDRLDILDNLLTKHTAVEVITIFSATNIRWYLLHPETEVSWPESIKKAHRYSCEKYRVYYFGNQKR